MNPKKPTTSPQAKGSRTTGVLVALIVAAVVAAIIVAMALGGTGDDTASTMAAESARIPTSGTLRQVSFSEAAGEAPPLFDTSLAVDPAVGMAAPTITASYFDNTEVTIDLADGQPRVVMFMAHWCPHCQDEVSSLVERFATEGIRSDVELLPISTNVDEGAPNYSPSQWLLGEGWSVPVLRDSANNDLAAGFGLSGFPFFVVVDEEGEIVTRRSGAVPRAQWNSFLDQALTGGSDIAG